MTDGTMGKAEFARHLGVDPAVITRYLSSGIIGPDALSGSGRSARILVAKAIKQIRDRRNPSQALGNGINTRLDFAPPDRDEVPTVPRPDSLDEQFKREKLRGAQMANRKSAEEEELRSGRFLVATEAQAEMRRIASSAVQSFEAELPSMASALAARFGISQRDVLHLLRAEVLSVRKIAAEGHRAAAAALSPFTETLINTDLEGDA